MAASLSAGGTVHLSTATKIEEYVHKLAADHLVHGWDLAVATDGDKRLDPAVVTEVATWFADREEVCTGRRGRWVRGRRRTATPRATCWPTSGGIPAGAPTTPPS